MTRALTMTTAAATGFKPIVPKATLKNWRVRVTLVVLFVIYSLVIWLNFHEASRRRVSVVIAPRGNDYVLMDVNVVNVDLPRLEMTARISFSLAGGLARDEVTPTTDLQ